MSRALCALPALACACRRQPPACFKVQSVGPHRVVEVFVLANAPERFDDLRKAVLRACGDPPRPAGAETAQWSVFRESAETPRNLVVGPSKQQSLERHTEDLILDVHFRPSACGDLATFYYYPRGYENTPPEQIAVGRTFLLSRAADAGPLPEGCAAGFTLFDAVAP